MSRVLLNAEVDIVQDNAEKGVRYNLTTEQVLNPTMMNQGLREPIPNRVDDVLGHENSEFGFMGMAEDVRKQRKNQKASRPKTIRKFLQYELRGSKNVDGDINAELEDYNIRTRLEHSIEGQITDDNIQRVENMDAYQGWGGFKDENNLSEYTKTEVKLYHENTIAESGAHNYSFVAGVKNHGGFDLINKHDKAVEASEATSVQLKTTNDKILDLDYAYLDGFNRMNKGAQEALKPEKDKEKDDDYIVENDMFKRGRKTLKMDKKKFFD